MATFKITNHNLSPALSYIFDTNVWMYIFAPIAGAKKHKQQVYSKLLADILSRKATIWISAIIVSEYVNAVLRLEFKQWMRDNKFINADFKHDFRPTNEYKTALSSVKAQVAEIIKICERRPDNFNSMNVEEVINSMEHSSYDFCDALIADVCYLHRDIHLVSDDTDITKADVPFSVITA